MSSFRTGDRPAFRSHFGACLHVPPGESLPYAYISQGWDGISTGGRDYTDVLRTRDFLTVERALKPNTTPFGWHNLASLGGKLIASTGYDGSHPPTAAYGDQVSAAWLKSDDGNDFQPMTMPGGFLPHEGGTAGFLIHEGYLYNWGGVYYSWPGGVMTLHANRKAFRLASDLTTWEQRTSDIGINRRSFAAVSLPIGILMHGGIDDSTNTLKNEMYLSTNGMQSISQIGGAMVFGTLMGHDFVRFGNRLVMLCGKYGNPAAPSYSNGVWSTANLSDPSNNSGWSKHGTPPFGGAEASKPIVMTVDGVETLFVYAGRAGTDLLRKGLWRTTDLENWAPMHGSDFWPD